MKIKSTPLPVVLFSQLNPGDTFRLPGSKSTAILLKMEDNACINSVMLANGKPFRIDFSEYVEKVDGTFTVKIQRKA
jgi:hypothetical protein